MNADTILLGRTFTADAGTPWANGVAVRDGVIVAVGSRDAVMRHCGADTMVWQADGLTCPAFNDAHIHLLEGALFDLWVNLHDTAAPQYLSVIAAAASQRGPRDWVRGGGWTMAAFPGGSPPRRDLDDVVGDASRALLKETCSDRRHRDTEHDEEREGRPREMGCG